jgi:uncharacterized cofD-like protein
MTLIVDSAVPANHSTALVTLPRTALALPRVVAIGGGTGLPSLLRGLKGLIYPQAAAEREKLGRECLTAIVTVTDDGGSSGRLRRELGILPPGDVRNCLAALAPDDSQLAALLQHRFTGENDLSGHPVGNLVLAALTQMTGEFQSAIEELADLLSLRGRVLPSTAEDVMLRAEFHGGEMLRGETAIAARGRPIKRLWLERSVRPLPETVRALINADVIVVGPGSLYTSILPNLLVDGIASTISGVDAVRIYVANLMTEPGETDDFTLDDHLDAIREHVGFDLFDYVLVNRRPLVPAVKAEYASQGSIPVPRCQNRVFGHETCVVERDLAWRVEGNKIRHAPEDLAMAVLELGRSGRPSTAGVPAEETALGSIPPG